MRSNYVYMRNRILKALSTGHKYILELQWMLRDQAISIPDLEGVMKELMSEGLVELKDVGLPLKRFVITQKGMELVDVE